MNAKACAPAAKHPVSSAVSCAARGGFGANGERPVSDGTTLMVSKGWMRRSHLRIGINR
jgi:hypothetical protein